MLCILPSNFSLVSFCLMMPVYEPEHVAQINIEGSYISCT